ncbi:hypothetical protein J2S49_000157 [Arcanobacterium wilhelmae]|uniref:site-specific DNA-methyltransferase (adenine-specific) n=1 Tax=Arcanobacterium wilhelmae TaxID=1803177 RepID=A0ABT9N8Q3_9ACTO|nr:hypothetical protein [Arcanobacterium wilhelmae]
MENKVLAELAHQQTSLVFEEIGTPLKVSLDQFYGIEINDFAVNVAMTALWIAELQANAEAQTIVTQQIEDLPLADKAHIVSGNALQIEWESVFPPSKASYIIGNPPFIGYSRLDADQKADRLAIFGKSGGVLDYVACWYRKAADYMRANQAIEAAFVSTNSICQGQQVAPLWKPIFDAGVVINFAHRTFVWANEAEHQAHVFCVIVSFSYTERDEKWVWTYRRPTADEREEYGLAGRAQIADRSRVRHLNGYLADAPDVFLDRRSKPISDVPEMSAGGKPTEGGHLLLSPEERTDLIRREPQAEKWIRKFSMGAEFIKGLDRYCLWLVDATPADLRSMPLVLERVKAVRETRRKSTKKATQAKAETPWRFDEIRYGGEGAYIGVPKVSSERRKYIPMGFVTDGMIPGDKLYFIPSDSLYVFGVLMSRVHNAWMRVVGGRLKSDYSYGNTTIYNNLVWPTPSSGQKTEIEAAAQAVLDARAAYPGSSLADLYDPDNDFLYPQLVAAHRRLDVAVEAAYGFEPGVSEEQIVAHLFELYNHAVNR